MEALDAIEQLTSKAVIWTVLIECDAAAGAKTWDVVLSDDHARKGRGRGAHLTAAMQAALIDLNAHCGGQIRSFL